jgi:hypothetical protein
MQSLASPVLRSEIRFYLIAWLPLVLTAQHGSVAGSVHAIGGSWIWIVFSRLELRRRREKVVDEEESVDIVWFDVV